MRTHAATSQANAATAERLCFYCNEGHCALCNGWDRTIVNGKIVEVPCAHGCREQQRKPNGKVASQKLTQRRA